MSPPRLIVALAVVVAAFAVPVSGAYPVSVESRAPAPVPTAPGDRTPEIVELYPNPLADGDRGEYVVVEFPRQTNLSGWTLSDGEDTLSLGGVNDAVVGGRVAISPDPAAARNLTDARVVAVPDFSLANGGETLVLARNGTTVATRSYEDAPEGERLTPRGWRSPLATNRSVSTRPAHRVRTFVLPDSPGAVLRAIRTADRRIYLAGYTFGSERVTEALRTADRRGVDVRILVDAAPVGGMTRRSARLLDSLSGAGVDVRVYGGDRAPYDYHHAKYAVVDDRAVVLTENWKPAGTGGHSSRGWGVVVESTAVASDLAAVFRADRESSEAIPWERYRSDASLVEEGPSDGSYPSAFAPRNLSVDRVEVLLAPDNAERELVERLRAADRSIRIQQVQVERGPLLRATLAAARRGVEVQVLLSSAWYVRDANRRLVESLRARAEREDLPVRAKLVDPAGRFEKVHAKGVVIDRDEVVLGSINWNNHSIRENRELAVVLEGDAVGNYYADVFAADWRSTAGRGSGNSIPVGPGLVLAVAAALLVALAVALRRIRFEG